MPSEHPRPGWITRRSVLAPAKVNLHLDILGRRPDGYHELLTLMAPLDWGDVLTLHRPAPRAEGTLPERRHPPRTASGGPDRRPAVRLTCSDPTLPVDGRNLVLKAAARLGLRIVEPGGSAAVPASDHPAGTVDITPDPAPDQIWLHLEKHLPHGAGLGGGSSDAAAAMRLLDEELELGLTEGDLRAAAADIGSDVAFFLAGGAAVCRGRGELVEPLPATGPGALPRLTMLLAVPAFGLSTPAVYREYAAGRARCADAATSVMSVDGTTRAAEGDSPEGRLAAAMTCLAPGIRWEGKADARRTVGLRPVGAIPSVWPEGAAAMDGTGKRPSEDFDAGLQGALVNGLEAPAFTLEPRVRGVRDALLAAGCSAALMTGSGSAVFGLCRDDDHARSVLMRWRPHCGESLRVVHTWDGRPPVNQPVG